MSSNLNDIEQIISQLKKLSSARKLASMKRVKINNAKAFGVSIYNLRKIAADLQHSRKLAEKLWNTNIHEARILASYIIPPEEVDTELAEKWVSQFDS